MLLSVAWRMALWSRVKEFPSWDSVRPKRRDEPKADAPQDWRAMKAAMRAHAELMTDEKKPGTKRILRKR